MAQTGINPVPADFIPHVIVIKSCYNISHVIEYFRVIFSNSHFIIITSETVLHQYFIFSQGLLACAFTHDSQFSPSTRNRRRFATPFPLLRS